MAKKTRSATEILDRLTGDDVALRRMIAEETLNSEVARLIYEARTVAGLTQQELAERIGTKQPVIARLEDADYYGRSLSLLQRIASALGHRIEIRFVPAGELTAERGRGGAASGGRGCGDTAPAAPKASARGRRRPAAFPRSTFSG
jgi:ribosome-binding protein aMBF1 (putative translation factor)